MNHEELQTLCIKAGESKFRGGQLFEWLYRHGISSFDSMLNINKSFREHLNEHFILHTLTVENSLHLKRINLLKYYFEHEMIILLKQFQW